MPSAVPAAASESVIRFFTPQGPNPVGGLIVGAGGNLYGELSDGYEYDGGAVYMLAPAKGAWTLRILHSFGVVSSGCMPDDGLTVDAAGNLYGVALCGVSEGVAFRLDRPSSGSGRWNESVLYAFDAGSERLLLSRLVFDAAGNLYGTTIGGGTRLAGTVFRLSPPRNGRGKWHETTLYNFLGGADGSSPNGVVLGASGVLYGTTTYGGVLSPLCGPGSCGTVFSLRPIGSGVTWQKTTLHAFDGFDGAMPTVPVTIGPDGTLYGTTDYAAAPVPLFIGGTIFALSPGAGSGSWRLQTLYRFENRSPDGVGSPSSPLALGSSGALYGTTLEAGGYASGSVFQLGPPARHDSSWRLRVLHVFEPYNDGYFPNGALLIGADGALYGTNLYGGLKCDDAGCGTAFRVTLPPNRHMPATDAGGQSNSLTL